MRYKIVPPVRDVAFLRSVADALPRVPNSVEDCCTRIRDRTDVTSRDQAREYLTFCQALGLATEDDGAYFRAFEPPTDEQLPDAFVDNILGAREVLETLTGTSDQELAGDAVSMDEIFEEAVDPLVPRWERNQGPEWEDTWRDRTERLCEWAVAFDLAERVDGGYHAVTTAESGEE